MPEPQEIEYEVYYQDECVAITGGKNAEREAKNYAIAYENDSSPFLAFVYKVNKTRELVR